MILFVHRKTYIRVIRLTDSTKPTDNLGKIVVKYDIAGRPTWLWDRSGVEYFRSWVGYQTLSGSEKRQIIGLLDNLNGVNYRSDDDMKTQWVKITGLRHSTV